MFASLPWYDLAETRGAHDRLWRDVADSLRTDGVGEVPDQLDRHTSYEAQWRSGALLLGQACGYDVAFGQSNDLEVLGAPRFAFEGCDGPTYRSLVVVREGSPASELRDLRGQRCVVNTPTSHSGMNVLRSLVAPLCHGEPFFGSVTQSGAHEHSLAALRAGVADVAAIDCVTYALLQRYRPAALLGTRVLQRTPCAVAPPFVTSRRTAPATKAALRRALGRVDCPAVGLRGVTMLTAAAYAPIAAIAEQARPCPDFEDPPTWTPPPAQHGALPMFSRIGTSANTSST